MQSSHLRVVDVDTIGPITELGERVAAPSEVFMEHCRSLDLKGLLALRYSLSMRRVGREPFSPEYQHVARLIEQINKWRVASGEIQYRNQCRRLLSRPTSYAPPAPRPAISASNPSLKLFEPNH